MSAQKKVHIINGGTIVKIRPHFGLTARAYGSVGRVMSKMCKKQFPDMEIVLHNTRMAGGPRDLETFEDVARLVERLKDDLSTKVLIMPVALADFTGEVDAPPGRLKTSEGPVTMQLVPNRKIIDGIRNTPGKHGVRKDIFLVTFKVTAGASPQEQYLAALHNLKRSSSNLVFANDIKNNRCMTVTPEEARYGETTNRRAALQNLIEMTYMRSHLSFTRSTVISGESVPWDSDLVPSALRAAVDHCIHAGAYKPFRGATVGHFACKIGEKTFLTSKRKTNFNDLEANGLVRIETDGDDTVLAYGSKPSVGGQSQRIIFDEHSDYDCIVHFHCPIKSDSEVPIASQREYECGSHQCGKNTSTNLKRFGNLSAVYLNQHGPNIVFNHDIDPAEVIAFIDANFDLTDKTGGYNVS